MLTAIWAILIFCVLIFIHEFGHFITAKMSGMTVHEFSVGMGPKLFGIGKKTKYSLRLLPLGGYVKLEGEDGESTDPDAFCNKSAVKRFAVLFAGAFMNILLGFVIFVIIYSSVGSYASRSIDSVIPGSAFENAGVKSGDEIVKMDGKMYATKIHSYKDISVFISLNGGSAADITFRRGGKEFTKNIKPTYIESEKRELFGFSPKTQKTTPWDVISLAFWECIFVIKSVILSIWWLIRGLVPASSVSGPVAIVSEIGAAAKMGWQTVLNFAGFISVNLGVMNLLPIPALDGGRILFLAIEKVRGKKMNPDREGFVNFISFVLLLLLMLIVTLGDIKKLI